MSSLEPRPTDMPAHPNEPRPPCNAANGLEPRGRGFFVTGTDTEIGKTLVSAALVTMLAARGLRTAAMKPVAAGAEWRDGAWRNEDAEILARASNLDFPRALTTPFLLREPAAPHIVAVREQVALDLATMLDCFDQLARAADCVVVEGVGGFRVPLDDALDTADLAVALGLPVVLVVGMRLGCINHALLSAESIRARGLPLAGWVANGIDPAMRERDANIDTVRLRLERDAGAPLLGVVPYLDEPSPAAAAGFLDLAPLLRCAQRGGPLGSSSSFSSLPSLSSLAR